MKKSKKIFIKKNSKPGKSGGPVIKKKPGAGPTTLKDAVEGIKKSSMDKDNMWDDQSAEEDNGAGSSTDSKRDKGKAEKFTKMRLAGSLPPYVVDLYDNAANQKESPRQFRTEIINTLFKRNPKTGRYSLIDDQPLFTEAKRVWEKKFGTDGKESYTKLVMRGLFFGNSESAGEVTEFKSKDGTCFYSFRKMTAGVETGQESSLGYTKQAKGTQQQADMLEAMFDKLDWSMPYKGTDGLVVEPGKKLPKPMAAFLEKAVATQIRLGGETMLPQESSDVYDKLKKAYVESQKMLGECRHILAWKEMPDSQPVSKDNFDKFMTFVAKQTLAHHELLANGKAVVKEERKDSEVVFGKDYEQLELMQDIHSTLQEHGEEPTSSTSQCLRDITQLASIGSYGKFSNKCYSDLMRRVEPNIAVAETYKTKLHFANPAGEHTQEVLLPHELFASMFEHENEAFFRNVASDEGTRTKFWDRMRSHSHPAWENHPLLHRNIKKAIPISVHGDEVPIAGIGKQWSKKLVNVSWASLLGKTETKSTQFWSMGLVEKTDVKNGPYATMRNLWKILAWSFTALWSGLWPLTDHKGNRFPEGSIQLERAGTPLAGGFFGVVWSLIGDLDYFTQFLQLPNYNNKSMPCSMCRTTLSGLTTWSNFQVGAAWRGTMWRPDAWHAWAGRSRNPIFSIPGVSACNICADYMHCKFLGTDAVQFGSVMSFLVFEVMNEGSPEDNLAACWRFIREYYRMHQTAVRFRSMSRLTMFVRKTGGPKLRGKAGELRYFGEVLLALWTTYCSNELELHKKITLLLKSNVFMERKLTETKGQTSMEDEDADELNQACSDMLVLQSDLARHFAEHGKLYFTLTSKAHQLQHACLLASVLNPRTVPCRQTSIIITSIVTFFKHNYNKNVC
ncbi:unnamed protein product [Symbiodinium sp. CCMP2592]|nr:unnamed protein product [Symbiodinium sp. CCMP2592]